MHAFLVLLLCFLPCLAVAQTPTNLTKETDDDTSVPEENSMVDEEKNIVDEEKNIVGEDFNSLGEGEINNTEGTNNMEGTSNTTRFKRAPCLLLPIPDFISFPYIAELHTCGSTALASLIANYNNCGYGPTFIDGYTTAFGTTCYNTIWVHNPGSWWITYNYVGGASVGALMTAKKAQGWRPLQVETYLLSGNVAFAVIFRKTTPAYRWYYRYSVAGHDAAWANNVKRLGYKIVNEAVVRKGGSIYFTCLYYKTGGGFSSWYGDTTFGWQTRINEKCKPRTYRPSYVGAYYTPVRTTLICCARPAGRWYYVTRASYATARANLAARAASSTDWYPVAIAAYQPNCCAPPQYIILYWA